MLKRAERSEEPRDERPIGELLNQLVEEGKAYARAELEVVKATASAKGKALLLPAGLFVAVFALAEAAIFALAIGIFFELDAFMDPILAGLIAALVFAGIAGGLGWYAVQRLKREL